MHAQLTRLAAAMLLAACTNPPGEVTVINQYTGVCPITISVGDDAEYVSLAAGTTEHTVNAGLVPISLRTMGVPCPNVGCTFIGSMATGQSGCGLYVADRFKNEPIVIGEGPASCVDGSMVLLPVVMCGTPSP